MDECRPLVRNSFYASRKLASATTMVKGLAAALVIALALLLASTAFSEGGIGIGGVVVDVDGNPIPGVQVVVRDSNNAVVGTTSTGPDGRFMLPVASGSYVVSLSKPGYVSKSLQVTVSKSSFYADLGTIVLDYSLAVSSGPTSLTLPVLSTVTLPITITNRGGSVEVVSISVSADCGINATTYLSGVEVHSLSLGPGESQSITLSVFVPYTQPRECSIRVVFNGTIPQVREITVNVVNQSRGVLSTQLLSFQVNPGATIQLPLKVANPIQDRIQVSLSLELPPGWSGTLTAGGVMTDHVSLGPGESVQLQLTIGVPKEARAGDYLVYVTARGVTPFFVERLPLSIRVTTGKPLLRLETATPHVDVYAGKTAKFPVTVTNLGDADCVVSFDVQGLPQGYTWSITDQQGNVFSQIYLKAGGQSTLYLSVSVPPMTEPTNLRLVLSAATNGSSDTLPLTLGVLGWYQLSFVTQNFYMELTPGSSGTFEVQVKNTGYSSLTNVALSASTSASGFTVSVNPTSVAMLKPGDTATFYVTVSVDPTTDAGDYYVSLSLKADQVEAIGRDLHVYVRPAGSPAYYIAGATLALIVGVYLAYRKFGRR